MRLILSQSGQHTAAEHSNHHPSEHSAAADQTHPHRFHDNDLSFECQIVPNCSHSDISTLSQYQAHLMYVCETQLHMMSARAHSDRHSHHGFMTHDLVLKEEFTQGSVTIIGHGASLAVDLSSNAKLTQYIDTVPNRARVLAKVHEAYRYATGFQLEINNLDLDSCHSVYPQASLAVVQHLVIAWFRLYVYPGSSRSSHPLHTSNHHQHYCTSLTCKF